MAKKKAAKEAGSDPASAGKTSKPRKSTKKAPGQPDTTPDPVASDSKTVPAEPPPTPAPPRPAVAPLPSVVVDPIANEAQPEQFVAPPAAMSPPPAAAPPAAAAPRPRAAERYELRPRRIVWSNGEVDRIGDLRDVSETGGLVVLESLPTPPIGISIKLSLPAKGANIMLRSAATTSAVVRWVGKYGEKPAFGILFTGDAESNRRMLYDLLVHD